MDIEEGNCNLILEKAKGMNLETLIVLGLKDEGDSVMIHNLGSDIEASQLLKVFLVSLETELLEELYARTKRSLN
jgi:hypothetical protein